MNKKNTLDFPKLMDRFEQVCKTRGLRLTHQRTEIFRALIRSMNHPTTEFVFNQVRKHLKTISLDTVYRTIATFEEFGLIKRVHLLDNTTRFDTNLAVHHHLVCTKCKRIEDFYWPDFDQIKLPKTISHWNKIEVRNVVINGLCSNCNKKK